MYKYRFIILLSVYVGIFASCTEDVQVDLFETVVNEEVGIKFSNNLEYNPEFNVYKYRNFYNGGGVALGDVNGDGYCDIYLLSLIHI